MHSAVPCEYSHFLDSARTLQQGQAGIARTALCSPMGKAYTTVYLLHSLPARSEWFTNTEPPQLDQAHSLVAASTDQAAKGETK